MTGKLARTVIVSLVMAFSAVPVAASGPLDSRIGHISDACRSPQVLGFITSDFGSRAATYLNMDIAIAEIRGMRQQRLVLRDRTHPVEREYCHATALTTDGQTRALWYLIERGFGFAGVGSNIEFCVSGLDPWYVYGAQCASLR
ncbi:hypothetical protein [Pararhizobium sp.]|uniref:hypothetical protein n=1 Tax=Pararhizobium sp. TaxID=1977563 RepID=UPI003BACFFFD